MAPQGKVQRVEIRNFRETRDVRLVGDYSVSKPQLLLVNLAPL
jgi:hypothetical protein